MKSSLIFVLSWLMEFRVENTVEFMIKKIWLKFRVLVEQGLFSYLLILFMNIINLFSSRRRFMYQIQPGLIIILWLKALDMSLLLIDIMILTRDNLNSSLWLRIFKRFLNRLLFCSMLLDIILLGLIHQIANGNKLWTFVNKENSLIFLIWPTKDLYRGVQKETPTQ